MIQYMFVNKYCPDHPLHLHHQTFHISSEVLGRTEEGRRMMDDIFLSRAALWHPDTSIVIMIPSHQIYFYFLFTTGTWAAWELGDSRAFSVT